MKKVISILLVLALCLSMVACGKSRTGNESYDYILYLLEQGNYDMAIHVIEGLRDGKVDGQSAGGQQSVVASGDHVVVQVPQNNGSDWIFEMTIANDTGVPLTLEAVVITDYLGSQPGPVATFEGDDLNVLPMGRLELGPKSTHTWGDMRPMDYGYNQREYIHIFRDPQGNEVPFVFVFDMRTVMPGGTGGADGNGDQEFHVAPEIIGNDIQFHMDVMNMSQSVLTLDTLLIVDWKNEQEVGTSGFEGPDLERLGLAGLVLQPGEGRGWDDGHPLSDIFDRRDYLFVFRDEQGDMVRYRYIFGLGNAAPQGSGGNGGMGQEEIQMGFPLTLSNEGDTPWQLQGLDIINLMDGRQVGVFTIEGRDLERINMAGLVLQPGERLGWNDGHPLVPDWNGREYRFRFVDGRGQQQIQSFLFENLHEKYAPVDYAQDTGKDLSALRHDVMFEQEVYPGVYWVPAVHLGQSRYTNQEIYAMIGDTPEAKRDKISTLYEALQLYQVGKFTASDDNTWTDENGIHWEHHKPGYHAVRTNTGCCATDSNWLRYILDGDYDEVGFLATSQRDASGHVYNYILQDGIYYFIDLTHYRAGDNLNAVEDGDMNSYYASAYLLGNIHAVKNVQDYVNYVQNDTVDPPGLMFQYTAENVLAVSGNYFGNGGQIIYEDANGQQMEVVFDDPYDNLTHTRAASPKNIPDWNRLP